jgi:anti-anti-sigma regulatory factor
MATKTNSLIQPHLTGSLIAELMLTPAVQAVVELWPAATKTPDWLQALVFRSILRRVYRRFSEHYPEWTASLFDEFFVQQIAGSLLTSYLEKASLPKPGELALAWDQQLGPASPPIRNRRIAELIPAAAELLDELKIELYQHPLFRTTQVSSPAKRAGHRRTPRQDMVVIKPNRAMQRNQAKITLEQLQARQTVTILHLHGPLDASSYLDLLAAAREVYQAGGRNIIFDMSRVSSIGISSLVALHGIAAILRGEEPLDPVGGWNTLYTVAHELKTRGLQPQFKLLNPQPQVKETLEQAGFKGFLEIHTHLETALASF